MRYTPKEKKLFALRVWRFRKSQGWSQPRLAKEMGVAVQTVWGLEKGTTVWSATTMTKYLQMRERVEETVRAKRLLKRVMR